MQKKLKIFLAILFFAVAAVITFFAANWVISLRDPVKLADFQGWVASLGAGGALLLFAIQFTQVVVAFIPGGPVQIVAGALFGPLGGLAICLGGTLLATALVFYLVSRFGHSIIAVFVEEQDINKYHFLNGEKRVERLVLLLFFLPGTPKDALTYLFALTKIRLHRFMLLSTAARIPAVVTSLVAGDSIVEGRWGQALAMFIVMTAAGVIGFFLQKIFRGHFHKKRSS